VATAEPTTVSAAKPSVSATAAAHVAAASTTTTMSAAAVLSECRRSYGQKRR